MRIAYVISSVEGGGAASPVPAVTRVLRNTGAHLEVFALGRRDGRSLPPMLADGLRVHVREGARPSRGYWAGYHWLDRELAAYRPTLIWTSLTRATLTGLLLGWHRHIPVVCWQHNARSRPLPRCLLWALRRRPAVWVGDSAMVTALTAQRFAVAPERLVSWPLFTADPDAPQAQPWQPGQMLRLGSLGRLHPDKGYGVLLDALALLRRRGFVAPVPFEIAIAGEGRERAALTAAAQRAGFAGLRLAGFLDRPRDFLAGLHLYLQPSLSEGLCIGMHETMQAGLPVIATTVGQMPHTLEAGRSGWLVPPGDASALAEALAAALADPGRLAAMGRAARARVLPLFSAAAFRQAGESALEHLQALQVCGVPSGSAIRPR